MTGKQVVRAQGWFSVGLGLAELAAPQQIRRVIGVKGRRGQRGTFGLIRLMGLREIAAGLGVLQVEVNQCRWQEPERKCAYQQEQVNYA